MSSVKMHNQHVYIITNDKVFFSPLLQYLWNPGVLSIGTSTFWFKSIISQQELTIWDTQPEHFRYLCYPYYSYGLWIPDSSSYCMMLEK